MAVQLIESIIVTASPWHLVALVVGMVNNVSLFLSLVGAVNVEHCWVCVGVALGGIVLLHLGDVWVRVDYSVLLKEILVRFLVHVDH